MTYLRSINYLCHSLKNFIINRIKFLVDSNLWIALATVSFYELTLLQIGEPVQINPTVLFLFFSSLFTYNFFKFLGDSLKDIWLNKNTLRQRIIIALNFSAILISLYYMEKVTILLLGFAAVLTFLYATPFLKFGKKDFSLRKIWFVKSVVVALVWAISTSIVPLLEFGQSMETIGLFSLEKFLFILGITIPYDIKDLKEDFKQEGMISFAMKFGVKKTILIGNFVLLTGLMLSLFLFKLHYVAIILAYSYAVFFNSKLDKTKSEYWYTFLIDSSIVFYFLVYFLLSF